MQMRIYYEDTDSGGIVYHGNYLKFCERARSALFFEKNLSPQGEDGGFVVHSLNARYHAALHLGDKIEVELELLETTKSSLTVAHRIYKIYEMQSHSTCRQEVFFMEAKLVYTQRGRAHRIPQDFLEVISWGARKTDQG
ncbi:YbgC/FadM family acyl-CoA thioesterase [Helicobacter mustelae]|uniref:Putative 4-hydroxybenzoyl-CoA thioesterase n=1 Tax=Helicobacter mustelae (strain ATCC 43772 / CCUG 25715 / CIP 103759 / LMG 18044 / NCTC 12198 / R85-136P) TaxID=679897 RepID=D3UJ89_HELM1|nr:YbgC/FadM family acyl-CoA thioesterase [Helicobacter mustelae]CBG40564.1 putative 4-hydroxybenzoyl-CoA thioesterase [Helicobacter mustelae 12198]SQH72061.1 4-hydroxybenzoyl-CoA thioesterase [Helicobacter mustelae]STP13204.1 4-hydroxybenzoyl-CoA thioesterase [Helicobacter mustelae]